MAGTPKATTTDSLYGGDIDTRIRQEIVLGIGGMRALKAMGLKPTVFHMNEGHSAFLVLEQIRLFMGDRQLSFDEALVAAVRERGRSRSESGEGARQWRSSRLRLILSLVRGTTTRARWWRCGSGVGTLIC